MVALVDVDTIRESLIMWLVVAHRSECCFNTSWSGRRMAWLSQARTPFLFVGVAVLESVRQSWYQSVGVLYIWPSFPDAAKLVSCTANTRTSKHWRRLNVWSFRRLRMLAPVFFFTFSYFLPPEQTNIHCSISSKRAVRWEIYTHCAVQVWNGTARSEEAKK